VLIGYGSVGRLVAAGIRDAGRAMVVVEDQVDRAREAEDSGYTVVVGNATDPYVLERAGIAEASRLLIAIPEGYEAGGIAERARSLRPQIAIIARAHSDAEGGHLVRHGADHVVIGKQEVANKMLSLAARLRQA